MVFSTISSSSASASMSIGGTCVSLTTFSGEGSTGISFLDRSLFFVVRDSGFDGWGVSAAILSIIMDGTFACLPLTTGMACFFVVFGFTCFTATTESSTS
jgi:hypothetical protein